MSLIILEYHQNIGGKIEKNSLEFSKYLLKEPYNRDSLFVSCVEGESMQPYIKDGSLVVADLSQKEFIEDAVFLVHKDDRMWIKQAKTINGKRYFVSINPEYSHLTYSVEDARLIARALLTFTNL